MDKLGDLNIEGEGKTPHVRTHLRLTLDRMEVMMGEFIQKELIPEIESCVKAACDDVLRMDIWKPKLEYQLRAGVQKMMDECVKAAVEQNWELRRQLTYLMGEEISKSVGEYIQHMKPEPKDGLDS